MAKKAAKGKKKGSAPKKIKAEFYFKVCDGNVLKNVKALDKALDKMSADVFYFHVNDLKNDFANWIKDIFKMEQLANDLYAVKSMDETKKIRKRHRNSCKHCEPPDFQAFA